MSTDEQTTLKTTDDPTWIVSVVFWFTLFVAAVIYAAVALAPKYERLLVLERDHAVGQWQLVSLEKRVQQLDRVARALEEDPQFAAELARSRFGAVDPDKAAIAISDELQINATAQTKPVEVELPWYYGTVKEFASNVALRWSSLAVASFLILLGFGFLHARYSAVVSGALNRMGSFFRSVAQRYQV